MARRSLGLDFYSNLYAEEESWRPTLLRLEFKSIFKCGKVWFDMPFSEEEVVGALKSMSGGKAFGPDEYYGLLSSLLRV